jgi:hypothetical protein
MLDREATALDIVLVAMKTVAIFIGSFVGLAVVTGYVSGAMGPPWEGLFRLYSRQFGGVIGLVFAAGMAWYF